MYENGLEIIPRRQIRTILQRVTRRNQVAHTTANNISQDRKRERAGCFFEAIMPNHMGEVAECTGDHLS